MFKEPKFHNETAAREWFEAARWPNGPARARWPRLTRRTLAISEHMQTDKRNGRPIKGHRRGPSHKRAILSLVERGGEERSFHVENAPVEKGR